MGTLREWFTRIFPDEDAARRHREVVVLLSRIFVACKRIEAQGKAMTDALTQTEETLTKIEEKVTETETTLKGLAEEVVALKDFITHPRIAALATRAQAILDRLTVAEDAADDQLTSPPAPPTEPTP